jgi:hypothetical protein
MDESRQQVVPLKKVSLALCTGKTEASMDSMKPLQSMEFIYGVGLDGLTHFECMLAGKHVGDELIFPVEKNAAHHQFAHLHRLLPGFPIGADPVFVKINIRDISEPTHREIVRSLAEAASCGCGCGSH